MKALLSTAVDLCLLRLGPQDLPASPVLLLIAILLDLLVGMLVMIGAPVDLPLALFESLFSIMLTLAALYLLLIWRGRLNRYNQTASALMLTELLINCLALPLLAWNQQGPSGEAFILLMVLIFWDILVIGHILRHAIDVPLHLGIAASLLFTLLSRFLMALCFPVTG